MFKTDGAFYIINGFDYILKKGLLLYITIILCTLTNIDHQSAVHFIRASGHVVSF
jgi:hypothetical protein